MNLDQIVVYSSPVKFKEAMAAAPRTLWVGALSFEDRCMGSLSRLSESNLSMTEGIALNYSTEAYPLSLDREQRNRNWTALQSYNDLIFETNVRQINIASYSFKELQSFVEKNIVEKEIDFVIFDITCLSKLHTLALAAELSQVSFKWVVAYTLPENYGNLEKSKKISMGWRDIIIAPLAETAHLFNESHSRGIILPGHETDRLIVALAELEPAGGVIVVTETPKRPDLRSLCESNNKNVIRQLKSMRSHSWLSHIVSLNDLRLLRSHIDKEIASVKRFDSPIILFPFGPKSFVFFAGLQLCSQYPDASWFVYPIPLNYDVNYSEGIENTSWFMAGE